MAATRRAFLGTMMAAVAASTRPSHAQVSSAGPGILLATSGGDAIDDRFRQILTAYSRKVVFIPTAASSLRSKYGTIWNPDRRDQRDRFVRELLIRFDAVEIIILHTRSRQVADTEEFVEPLRTADAVWMSGGNAGRLTSAYLDTRVADELRAVVSRGGIVAGESAGAIVQGSYVVRGNPDKPVLMVDGRDRGFGFLPDVAINPHLTSARRENELVSVVDRHPHLLGLGIDDDAGLLVRGGIAEVIGSGRIAVYDNQRHADGWYSWLKAGDRLDLNARRAVPQTIR
jgi:cyanophycinase